MGEGFGLGDGMNDLSNVGAVAEAEVTEAQRRGPHARPTSGWPGIGTILWVLLVGLVAIILLGWTVTAITSGT